VYDLPHVVVGGTMPNNVMAWAPRRWAPRYFAMPEAPFGAMAEQILVDPRRTIALPDNLDDVIAAALANPGMPCFAALVERAHFQAGGELSSSTVQPGLQGF
jgi:NADPH:quinone reductase-like Zn-dependent oxidoreductase